MQNKKNSNQSNPPEQSDRKLQSRQTEYGAQGTDFNSVMDLINKKLSKGKHSKPNPKFKNIDRGIENQNPRSFEEIHQEISSDDNTVDNEILYGDDGDSDGDAGDDNARDDDDGDAGDEADDHDDMSGDEEPDAEDDEELDETPNDIRPSPVAELNVFEEELYITMRTQKKTTNSNFIRRLITQIIEGNKGFILRRTKEPVILTHQESNRDRSTVSRILNNNYLILPDGVSYLLGYFFTHTPRRKVLKPKQLGEFIESVINEEKALVKERKINKLPIRQKDLFSDAKIAKMYSEQVEKRTKKSILREREKLGIKPIKERLKDDETMFNE